MEAQFEDGTQDLSHEEEISFEPQNEANVLKISEQMVRRISKIAFLKMAQIRKKEYWELTEEELDEFVPGLTAYINQTDWLADLVEIVDTGSGPGLFFYAFFYRAAKDFRESRLQRTVKVKKSAEPSEEIEKAVVIGPNDPIVGEFNPPRGKMDDF